MSVPVQDWQESQQTIRESVQWFRELYPVLNSIPIFKPYLPKFFPEGVHQDAPTLFQSHRRFMLSVGSDSRFTSAFAAAVRAYEKINFGLEVTPLEKSSPLVEQSKNLRETGFSFLPSIDSNKIEEMRNYFKGKPVLDGRLSQYVTDLSSYEENILCYPHHVIANCPHFLEIANDPQVLNVVENYIGAVPTITNIGAWRSLANRPSPKEAQFFHYDFDDYRFLKLFIYLTDVDETSGPHVYVERTHSPELVTKTLSESEAGLEAGRQWYLSTLRKSDEDVQKFFGIKPRHVTGPAGSLFIADTRGIHKGLMPENKERFICQVTYATTPYLLTKPDTLKVPSSKTSNIRAGLASRKSRYLNRIFLRYH